MQEGGGGVSQGTDERPVTEKESKRVEPISA